jgi:hypothetical protein
MRLPRRARAAGERHVLAQDPVEKLVELARRLEP